MITAWWIWDSPAGIAHLVPGTRPCATCGRHHEQEQEVPQQ